MVGSRDNYLPEAWINEPDLYPFFLLTTVPGLLLYCAEFVVAEKLRRSRNYAYVPILRYILFANLASSLIAIAINNKYFEGSSQGFFNIMTMIWPIIWIPYFYFSKRVKSVFKKPESVIQIDQPGRPETGRRRLRRNSLVRSPVRASSSWIACSKASHSYSLAQRKPSTLQAIWWYPRRVWARR